MADKTLKSIDTVASDRDIMRLYLRFNDGIQFNGHCAFDDVFSLIFTVSDESTKGVFRFPVILLYVFSRLSVDLRTHLCRAV